jgi:hypothetical protein
MKETLLKMGCTGVKHPHSSLGFSLVLFSLLHSQYYCTIMIIHRLSIYTSMKHSLLLLKLLVLVLNSSDTMSDVRKKAFTLLF